MSAEREKMAAVGASVTENKTVENMERIFIAAKANGYAALISHPSLLPDRRWLGIQLAAETDEFETRTFAREGLSDRTGFANSGADWLDRFKPYIEDDKTIIASPHKVLAPRKPTTWSCNCARNAVFAKIILGGMLANMCVQFPFARIPRARV